ncbi:MAG: hypothetical protein BWY11_00045 [Firmicutes bacterium ADurb.Bin182]|nr:MAG: hypothetical protein BWY11_00045 [Firmicutes bacterium ADurb.Bin182]
MLGELQVSGIVHDGVEILIQAVFTEEIRFFLYLFIVVNILLQVEKVLTVVFIVFNELPADGVHDVLHDGFNRREQEIFLHNRQRDEQHQVVLQVLRRKTELCVEHDGSQTMNAERGDNLECNRLISSFLCREGAGDDVLQHTALLQHFMNGGLHTLCGVAFNTAPVSVIGNNTGLSGGYLFIDDGADGFRYGLQHFALLNDDHALECADVGRMNRE